MHQPDTCAGVARFARLQQEVQFLVVSTLVALYTRISRFMGAYETAADAEYQFVRTMCTIPRPYVAPRPTPPCRSPCWFDVRGGLCDERLRADNTIYYVARVSRNARASAFSEPWNTPTITVVKTRSTQFYRVNSSCASSIPAAAASSMHPHGPWECIEPLRSRLGGRGRD